jgi:hypothetical protein
VNADATRRIASNTTTEARIAAVNVRFIAVHARTRKETHAVAIVVETWAQEFAARIDVFVTLCVEVITVRPQTVWPFAVEIGVVVRARPARTTARASLALWIPVVAVKWRQAPLLISCSVTVAIVVDTTGIV